MKFSELNESFNQLFNNYTEKANKLNESLEKYIGERFFFSRNDEYGYPIPAEDFGLSEEELEDLVGEAGFIKGIAVSGGDSFNDGYFDVEFDNGESLGAVSGIHLHLVDEIEECLSKLNEAAISPEEQHDSDLIRSILDKIRRRVNAKLTPEEQAVLDKYGIKRTYRRADTGNLTVGNRDLDRPIDTQSAEMHYSKSYNNGNRSKINYARRAKLYGTTRGKDSQIFTSPWSADNDQINAHGYNRMRLNSLQDAERYEQGMPETGRIETMRMALGDRKRAQGSIDNADSERARRMAKAQADFDKAKANADWWYDQDTVRAADSKRRAQKEIDALLKRKPLGEAYDVREYTNMVLELGDGGLVSWQDIAMMALKFMSEDDVKRMAELNGLVDYFESDDDDNDEVIS